MVSMTTTYSIVKQRTSVVDTVPIVMSKSRMSIELIVEGLGRQEKEGQVMSIVCCVLCALVFTAVAWRLDSCALALGLLLCACVLCAQNNTKDLDRSPVCTAQHVQFHKTETENGGRNLNLMMKTESEIWWWKPKAKTKPKIQWPSLWGIMASYKLKTEIWLYYPSSTSSSTSPSTSPCLPTTKLDNNDASMCRRQTVKNPKKGSLFTGGSGSDPEGKP